MSGGMVPLPDPPVKAPSPNCCPSPSKPFACHTSGKSLESSPSSDAIATDFDSVPGCSNSFIVISFADPHPLNSVVSYRYKNSGGRASSDAPAAHFDPIVGSTNSFPHTLLADPHPLNPLVSHFYKIIGGGEVSLSHISSFSNPPNSQKDSSYQKLAARKNRLCYTGT